MPRVGDRVTAYKLLSVKKDGSIGPLFINRRQRIPIGEWLTAEAHRTPGYKFRPGWHVTLRPVAPHLKMEGRAWFEVEVSDWEELIRPPSQGGVWLLAQEMKVIKAL